MTLTSKLSPKPEHNTTQKLKFSIRISSVNVTKSRVLVSNREKLKICKISGISLIILSYPIEVTNICECLSKIIPYEVKYTLNSKIASLNYQKFTIKLLSLPISVATHFKNC